MIIILGLYRRAGQMPARAGRAGRDTSKPRDQIYTQIEINESTRTKNNCKLELQ